MFEMKNDSYFEWESASYLDQSQLKYFHDKLISLRSEFENSIKKQLHQMNVSDLPPIEEIERSTLAVDREIGILNQARNWELIQKIDKALAKINNGTYGYCEETEEPIGIERLQANPMSEFCLGVQAQYEMANQKLSAKAFYRQRHM